jgi:nucleotide-binding universal stress UspA family protein
MSYATLLLHMDLERPNAARLAVAAGLAERFDALVIGAAAADPQPPVFADGIYPVDTLQVDRELAERRIGAAEAEFREAFAGRAERIRWQDGLAAPAPFVARLSRGADLVVTGAPAREVLPSPAWRLDVGDLVMMAGRPVLLVPDEHARALDTRTAVLGWKESREARRAAADALPLLRLADRVLVAWVAEGDDSAATGAEDVAAWLGRHGVAAEVRRLKANADPASQLRTLALDENAGLIVAGAYGRSRTREWIFGGATHELLARRSAQCLLMSH